METKVWPVEPFAAISFVAPNLAIGGLMAYGEPLSRFGLVLNVAWEIADYGTETSTAGVFVQHARLDDSFDIDPMVPEIERAVGLVVDALGRGDTVLVTCAAGRNRSGLVAAEAMIRMGLSSTEAIRTVQLCRDKALTNHVFARWLRRPR